jgi:hypothetical protein
MVPVNILLGSLILVVKFINYFKLIERLLYPGIGIGPAFKL